MADLVTTNDAPRLEKRPQERHIDIGRILIYAVLIARSLVGIFRGSEAAWVIMAIIVSVLLMDLARVSYTSRTTWLFIVIMAYYSQGFGLGRQFKAASSIRATGMNTSR